MSCLAHENFSLRAPRLAKPPRLPNEQAFEEFDIPLVSFRRFRGSFKCLDCECCEFHRPIPILVGGWQSQRFHDST